MVDLERLAVILEELPAKYTDFRVQRRDVVETALRRDSFDFYEHSSESVVCRVVARGYGIASTDRTDMNHVRQVSRLALDQAEAFEHKLDLLPTAVEEGEVEHPQRKVLDREEVCKFLRDLRSRIRDSLSDLYRGSELVLSHHDVNSTLITSEGTAVRERSPTTDITIYILAKGKVEGYASRILGGKGGFEAVLERPWDSIVADLTRRAKDSSNALASKLDGRRVKVILDSEGAGVLAHELAHMLEADIYRSLLFANLRLSSDAELEVVDDPTLTGAYGSFHWDDESVVGRRKTLLSKEGVNLLHTRLTAKPSDIASNARGVTRQPRPLMSNILIKPSDWRRDEIFQETRSGVYTGGIIRADSDVADGRIELVPEVAYLIENKQITRPIKHLRIMGNIRDIENVDAIGKEYSLRPNVEKGFPISEGCPYIRVNGITCY